VQSVVNGEMQRGTANPIIGAGRVAGAISAVRPLINLIIYEILKYMK